MYNITRPTTSNQSTYTTLLFSPPPQAIIEPPMFQLDQVRPLAIPSPEPPTTVPAYDAEAARKMRSSRYMSRRNCILCCCGCVGVVVLLLGFISLAFALVFKIKDPSLTMKSMNATGLHMLPEPAVLHLNLTADLSINNPNNAPFAFGNSSTGFFYKGEKVAEGYADGGKIGRDRAVRMNVTVHVVTKPNVTEQKAGQIELTSYTEIAGSVNVLGIYKRHKTIMVNCTMWPNLSLPDQELNKTCNAVTR